MWLALGAVVLAGIVAAGLWWWQAGSSQPQFAIATGAQKPAADFTLASTLGRPLSLSDLRGKNVLIYFGYTSCPDVCPTTLADLRVAMQQLGPQAEKFQVLFVTVDPERDTVERLHSYLSNFNSSFVGLTGPVAAIEKAAGPLGIVFQKHPVAGAAGYLMDHTSAVLVVDKDGYVRWMFPYGVSGEQMAADLNRFVQ